MFAALIAKGVSSGQASRIVGINPRTGKRWRKGRKVVSSSGRVLEYAPVITARPRTGPSGRSLSQDERIRIADLRCEGLSVRQVAARLGRAASTVSRELRRHAREDGSYRPFEAHRQALKALARPRRSRLAGDEGLREYVTCRLKAHWSPEQIAHELRVAFPDAPSRWALKRSTRPSTAPTWEVCRVSRPGGCSAAGAVSVSHAAMPGPPAAVDGADDLDQPSVRDGARACRARHWEGDLIVGSANKSAIVTLVERTTRYTLLGHLPGRFHGAEPVRDAVVAALAQLPAYLRRTLTWDQGSEMASHEKITAALDLPVYFADPHSPWQRPTNEDTNGLLRDWFPKGTDLSLHPHRT